MKTIDEIKRLISRHKTELEEKYHVNDIGFFGSYVRNEQKDSSDLDVLVEYDEAPSLLEFVELQNYLSEISGVKVDLVRKKALKPRIGAQVLKELVPL